MKWPNPEFAIGDIVYPKVAATTENAGMVIGYLIRPDGFCYLIAREDGGEGQSFEMELTNEVVY